MRAKLAGYNARRLESNEQVYERALNHRSDSYKIDGEKNTWRTHERMCVQSVEKKQVATNRETTKSPDWCR